MINPTNKSNQRQKQQSSLGILLVRFALMILLTFYPAHTPMIQVNVQINTTATLGSITFEGTWS